MEVVTAPCTVQADTLHHNCITTHYSTTTVPLHHCKHCTTAPLHYYTTALLHHHCAARDAQKNAQATTTVRCTSKVRTRCLLSAVAKCGLQSVRGVPKYERHCQVRALVRRLRTVQTLQSRCPVRLCKAFHSCSKQHKVQISAK